MNYTITLSGSFRKHYGVMCSVAETFIQAGFRVLSPTGSNIIDPGVDFPRLASDGDASPAEIEQKHLAAIYEGDALYVVNPDGYIGPSTGIEIGWAMSFHKAIFFSRACNEELFNSFGMTGCNVDDVREALANNDSHAAETLGRFSTVEMLQRYVAKAVEKRGFADETPRDILLLLVEEVGELAKAIRKISGLKTDVSRRAAGFDLANEFADVFIYLLDLANSCHIDLLSAMRDKETINEKRAWHASRRRKG